MIPAVKIYKHNALTRLNKKGNTLLLFSSRTGGFHEISATHKKLSEAIIEKSAGSLEKFIAHKIMDFDFDIAGMPIFMLPRYRFTIRAEKTDGTSAFIPQNLKFILN